MCRPRLRLFTVWAMLVWSATASAGTERDLKKLVDQAARAWADGKTDDAIRLLENAKAIRVTGRIVYNLARAYERAGDQTKAIASYEEYLALPDTEALVVKRARLALAALYRATAKAEVAATPVAPVVVPPAQLASDLPKADPNPPPESSAPALVPAMVERAPEPALTVTAAPTGHPLRVAGVVAASTGVVSVAVGAIFGGWASATASAERSSVDPVLKPQLRESATARATVADACLISGAAVAALGTLLLVLDHP